MRYMLSCVKLLQEYNMNNWLNIIEIVLSLNGVLYDSIDSYTFYDKIFHNNKKFRCYAQKVQFYKYYDSLMIFIPSAYGYTCSYMQLDAVR